MSWLSRAINLITISVIFHHSKFVLFNAPPKNRPWVHVHNCRSRSLEKCPYRPDPVDRPGTSLIRIIKIEFNYKNILLVYSVIHNATVEIWVITHICRDYCTLFGLSTLYIIQKRETKHPECLTLRAKSGWNDFLWCSMVHLGGISPVLNVLLADHHVMEWMGAIVQDDLQLGQHPPLWQSESPVPPPQHHWPCGSLCSVFWRLLPSACCPSTQQHRV